ncbi:MAG: helix-turn-helix domain-containing protein [Deltaproteobacteria bacterium]|nr:helix-turn-helix domain-containing protein [Deltaproteobacteria bacterium]
MPNADREPHKVAVVALEGALASTVTGPLDIFGQAGVLWNHISETTPRPWFQVGLVSPSGGPVTCQGGLRLIPHGGLDAAHDADLVIISAGSLERLGAEHRELIPWLRERHAAGASLASVCVGAFFLAETGLLDGRVATTHWAYAGLFRGRYPAVDLRPERLVTDAGSLFCSGGVSAYVELCLYLVERTAGFEAAHQAAQALVLAEGRDSQTPYAIFDFQKRHADREILAVQTWLEDNHAGRVVVEDLAPRFGMSPRNLKRRFKRATGDTPLAYLQRCRVESAKRALMAGRQGVEEVSAQVGYEDTAFFRRVFKRHTGQTPAAFRRKYQARG